MSQHRRDYLSKYRIPPLPSTSLLELDSTLLISTSLFFGAAASPNRKSECSTRQLPVSLHTRYVSYHSGYRYVNIYMYACGRERTKHKRSPDMFFFSYPNAPNHPTTQPSTTAPINQSCTKNVRRPKMPILLLVSQLLLVFCGASFVSPSPFHPLPHTHTHIPSLTSTHTHTLSPNWEFAHTAFQWGRVPRTKLSYGSLPCNRDGSCQNVLLTPHMTTHKNNKTKNIYNVCLSGPRRSIVRPLVSHKESSWLVQATVSMLCVFLVHRSVGLSVCLSSGRIAVA